MLLERNLCFSIQLSFSKVCSVGHFQDTLNFTARLRTMTAIISVEEKVYRKTRATTRVLVSQTPFEPYYSLSFQTQMWERK